MKVMGMGMRWSREDWEYIDSFDIIPDNPDTRDSFMKQLMHSINSKTYYYRVDLEKANTEYLVVPDVIRWLWGKEFPIIPSDNPAVRDYFARIRERSRRLDDEVRFQVGDDYIIAFKKIPDFTKYKLIEARYTPEGQRKEDERIAELLRQAEEEEDPIW